MIFEEGQSPHEAEHETDWRDFAGIFVEGFESWSRAMGGAASDENRLKVFAFACAEAVSYVGKGLAKPDAIDALFDMAHEHGLVEKAGADKVNEIIAKAFEPPAAANGNGQDHHETEDPSAGMGPQPEPSQSKQQQRAGPLPLVQAFPINEVAIPRRQWLIPGLLLREHLTVLVAPSGSGKSLLTLQVGMAMAAGVEWSGWRPRGELRILVVNAEDDTNELRRRLAASLYKMDFSEDARALLVDRFLIVDNPDGVVLAKFDNRTKTLVRTPLMDELIRTINGHGVDCVFVDPFAETFEGDENSNSELKWAGMLWREVARRTHAGICLVHHTKKYASGMAGDVDAARGASSLIGIARIVSTLFPMTTREAEMLGIQEIERNAYLRYDDAKANLNLKSGFAKWFKKETVLLHNEGDDLPGDQVGVLIPWKPTDPLAQIPDEKIFDFFKAVDVGMRDSHGVPTGELYTFHSRKASEHEMGRYLGTFAAEFFGLELTVILAIIKKWQEYKRLYEVDYMSKAQRKVRKGVHSELWERRE